MVHIIFLFCMFWKICYKILASVKLKHRQLRIGLYMADNVHFTQFHDFTHVWLILMH